MDASAVAKRSRLLTISALFFSALMFVGPANAAKVSGVTLDDSITVGGETLPLRGAGLRKRLFIKLYVGSLYTAQSDAHAAEIISADEPMAIRINTLSDLLTRKKMVGALKTGFKKSTGGNTAPIQNQIDQLTIVLPDKIRPGTTMTLAYEPGVGTHLLNAEDSVAIIPGLEFKQALFGIWLSDKPAQASLKKQMLGN